MTLGEILEKATHSDRLIVCDTSGHELYRGFVACIGYGDGIDLQRTVKRFGLSTNIFRKENRAAERMKEYRYGTQPEPDNPENISDFKFSDLEMMIYTKVVLED